MIYFDKIKNIYLYASSCDMRMGMHKIQAMVAFHYKVEEILHSMFIFCSGTRKTIKIYYEDEWGCWLLQNNIAEGKFKWPEIGESVSIDKRQLDWLLKGLDVIAKLPKPRNKEEDYY